jgi:hypothetical protein
MVGLPCLANQCAKLHLGGWTWAVFTRVYLEFYDFYSVSPENFGSTHVVVDMSSCPQLSVRLLLDDSRTIWCWALLRQSAEQLQTWLNSDKIIGHSEWRFKSVLDGACDINSHQNTNAVRHTVFLHYWQCHKAQQYTQNALLRFHFKNVYASASRDLSCTLIFTMNLVLRTLFHQ